MPKVSRFLEEPSLQHLKRLTTGRGIIQHAKHDVPDPSFGYSIDDQARALISCLWYEQRFGGAEVKKLISVYFKFLERAQTDSGDFHNFYDINGVPLDEKGSADSFSRTLWALAEVIVGSTDQNLRRTAKRLWDKANIKQHLDHQSMRTRAYLALAHARLNDRPGSTLWANELIQMLRKNTTNGWYWFEHTLTYCNAMPVYALACAYEVTKNPQYLEEAQKTFTWLNRVSRIDGTVAPIGQNGWFHKTAEKAHYDQQPVDAAKMVMASAKLYQITDNNQYLETALEWMRWYDGENTQKRPLINQKTGGIYDGLTPTGVNSNQGAESIITFLLAYLSLTKTIEK